MPRAQTDLFARPLLLSFLLVALAGSATADETEQSPRKTVKAKLVESGLPEMPDTLTSFGGTRVGDSIYVYGGHTGSAHSYSKQEQSNRFYRLSLTNPKAWEELPGGPRLQGLALVGHQDSVYRLGGFTALNEEGEDQRLRSSDEFARFDVASKTWVAMPPMPEPRSSFDSAVVGDTLLVVGGWSMQPDAETEWHDTAWTFDLGNPTGKWKSISKPGFERRALSVAAFDNQFFVIGGMQSDNKMTKRVDVYDPKKNVWSKGPTIQGDTTSGFGSAAFATGGRLYVSTIRGDLERLSETGDQWEVLCRFEPARFFHRMLPRDDDSLLLLGGANMSIGKFTDVEQLDIVE